MRDEAVWMIHEYMGMAELYYDYGLDVISAPGDLRYKAGRGLLVFDIDRSRWESNMDLDLRKGDVIITLNDLRVGYSPFDLVAMLGRVRGASAYSMYVYRDGKFITLAK